jgi:hypothetical protein
LSNHISQSFYPVEFYTLVLHITMGRAPQPAKGYRDDPDAVSLHTTPDDYAYDDASEASGLPPSYADSESESTTAITAPIIRHVTPSTTRTDHNHPSFKHGNPVVEETVNLMDSQLDSDPLKLEEVILASAKTLPTPYIYIMGTHKETIKRGDKQETKHITDFRIVLNMQHYLTQGYPGRNPFFSLHTPDNGEKTHRGSVMKCRAPGAEQDIEVGAPKPTLTEWCHRYCASPRLLRIFRLQRTVPGMDTMFLKNRIEGLITATNYRGHINITFPVEDRNLDIYTSNFVNRWRLNTWIRWAFYLSFLWIFTWPYLFFMTKRYAVVRAEWPFSVTNEHGRKTYISVSEEEWFEKWYVAVKRLVLDRYQGEANEDMMKGVMERPEDPPMPGTVRTGNEGFDNAVGMLTQGFQVARALSGSGGVNIGRVQGGWGYDT